MSNTFQAGEFTKKVIIDSNHAGQERAESLMAEQGVKSFAISTATSTLVNYGPCHIDEIRVVGGTMGGVTIYDAPGASGKVLLPAVTPVAGEVLLKNVPCYRSLYIVTAAATVITGTVKV